MSNKLKKKNKKRKKSTWLDVIWYGFFGTIIDCIFTIDNHPGEDIHLTDIGDGDLDEWGRNKATLVRSLMVLIADGILAYILDFPSTFESGEKNRIIAAYCLIALHVVVAVICIVVIYKKAKYKRK